MTLRHDDDDKMEKGENEKNDLAVTDTWKRKLSHFILESREVPTVPPTTIAVAARPVCCRRLSRGLMLSISALLFIGLVLMWLLFSSETHDAKEKLFDAMGKGLCRFTINTNCSGANNTSFFDFSASLSANSSNATKANWLLIVCTTLLLVVCIIMFVFLGATCRYVYEKAKYRPEETQGFWAFVFGEQNTRDALFYLEQNTNMHDGKSCCKNSFYGNDSNADLYGYAFVHRESIVVGDPENPSDVLLSNPASGTSTPLHFTSRASFTGDQNDQNDQIDQNQVIYME